MKSLGIAPLMLSAPATPQISAPAHQAQGAIWSAGPEGQRKADLGNGTFLNPILAGDHPDPSILKDGKDYYMAYSTFDAYPGLLIWHSQDLVNWEPIGPALRKNIGSVWAPELCKHQGRFYIYIPTRETSAAGSRNTSWVIWADHIEGPWSEPVDLDLPKHIDPGHAVGEDGSRWLFLSDGDRVRLSDDGLATVGKPEHIYDPWRFPDDWDSEGFSPEGPKITRHGEYFYMILAVGGTAGPATGHMVIAARSRSIHGPWEHHPRNPLVRTGSQQERWWSRGHATLVEGPNGDWWSVYHGYENGFWTLGRQTLLAPVSWTRDGWLEFGGDDLSLPLPKPKGGRAGPHGLALSDDFTSDKYGIQWSFFNPAPDEASRLRRGNGVLHLAARGAAPSSSPPLLFIAGEQDYEFECEIEVDPGARAGLLLFYDSALYCGVSFDAEHFIGHKYGIEHSRYPNPLGPRMFIRMRNMRHIVRVHISADGKHWKRFERTFEVSGYHHNVRGGFLALRPGIFVSGKGEARIRNFKYRVPLDG
ncbi:family 43 glycosylhydrolase [Pseudoduganella sp. LjRoot289]|uniref:family 43 glycosylhydrolase n=1 Tax=Pseudoduganella sp. LjRoot289 TaxID=3342314 RepID=UPI003ECFF862